MTNDKLSSLDKVLDILLMFAGHGDVVTRQEIEKRFGLSRSSTYRYLQSLRRKGLITAMSRSGEYVLNPGVVRLVGLNEERGRNMSEIAAPALHDLAAITGESAMITHRAGDRVLCVRFQEGGRAVRVGLGPAANTALYEGASAKVHLAHLPRKDIERILAHCRDLPKDKFPHEMDEFEQELKDIRERGFATSYGELEEAVVSVAMPMFCADGGVLAVVSVAALAERARPAKEMLDHLRIAIARITREWCRGADGPF